MLGGLPGRVEPYQEGNNNTEGSSISNGHLLGVGHAKH